MRCPVYRKNALTRHPYREEVDGPRIQERPSRHLYRKSESTPIQGDATRPLYRETTRPLSMNEEFQVYAYTGRYLKVFLSLPSLRYVTYTGRCNTSPIQGEKINPYKKLIDLSDVTTRSTNRVRRRMVSKETTDLYRLQASERERRSQ